MELLKKPRSRFLLIVLASFVITATAGFMIKPDRPFRAKPVTNKACVLTPNFKDYAIGPADIYTSRPADLNLVGYPEAEAYRAFIRSATLRGVNFAGKYIVAEWGCGTDCQNHAIVNATTGKLIAFGLRSAYGVEFYKNSRLIAFNPNRGLEEGTYSAPLARTQFYSIENGKLIPVCN
ncbi:MAG: hypothetical protein NTY66_02580 [Candidatus Vogelbacteria bacterium]|nr:hypothetical protein [Candidatus Vogelbacteria bacterium]